MLSLRPARGVVDGGYIPKEGDALLAQFNERLNGWRTNMELNVTCSLLHYFAPKQGMFAEWVERLVRDDVDLAVVMKGQVANEQVSLNYLFQQFVGENSQIVPMLDPSSDYKLLQAMEKNTNGVIQTQNASILQQRPKSHCANRIKIQLHLGRIMGKREGYDGVKR